MTKEKIYMFCCTENPRTKCQLYSISHTNSETHMWSVVVFFIWLFFWLLAYSSFLAFNPNRQTESHYLFHMACRLRIIFTLLWSNQNNVLTYENYNAKFQDYYFYLRFYLNTGMCSVAYFQRLVTCDNGRHE